MIKCQAFVAVKVLVITKNQMICLGKLAQGSRGQHLRSS